MQGWIKLHRCLMSKPIWTDSTPEQKTILITLLMMANHQGREWEFQGQRYTAEPGQFVTSLESITHKCGKGITIQNVRTALKRFEKYEFLTNESTNKNRLITIVNWVVYQSLDDEPNKLSNIQLTSNQQATNKQLTTNKNVKNEKNEMNVNKKIIYAEFVSMKKDQHDKLIEEFGEAGTKDRIERLNLYKGSTGKKYKDDYLTILNWERKNKQNKGGASVGANKNTASLAEELNLGF